jgi:hypothetical protein
MNWMHHSLYRILSCVRVFGSSGRRNTFATMHVRFTRGIRCACSSDTWAQRRRRRAICAGFADILTVDVSDLDASGRARNVRRLGFGAPVDRWIDLGPHLEPCPPVRQFQVLSPPIATVAFKEWLELGRTDTFSCEDV